MTPIRILLADDHTLVRRGLRLVLEAEQDLLVVAEAPDGVEAIEMARLQTIDLAILDVAMPRMTGLHAAREISRRSPNTRLLILSMYDNEQYYIEALRVGASGYVLKSVADRDLVQACHAAMQDQPFIYPGMESTLLQGFVQRIKSGESIPDNILTVREEEIVKLVAEGNSSREIADLLVISAKTVDRHRENILSKLGMRDRLELTRYAIRCGLVEP